jgi:hypothetical protein
MHMSQRDPLKAWSPEPPPGEVASGGLKPYKYSDLYEKGLALFLLALSLRKCNVLGSIRHMELD